MMSATSSIAAPSNIGTSQVSSKPAQPKTNLVANLDDLEDLTLWLHSNFDDIRANRDWKPNW